MPTKHAIRVSLLKQTELEEATVSFARPSERFSQCQIRLRLWAIAT